MRWLLLMFFVSSNALAWTPKNAPDRHYGLLEPKYVAVDIYRYEDIYDPYLAPLDRELRYGSNWTLNLNIFRFNDRTIYWNNRLHFDQSRSSGHIKHAGWEYEIGGDLLTEGDLPKIQLFKHHHSRHVLEETRETHFPVYDYYGFRFILLGRPQ